MRATQARFLDLLGADRTQFIIPVYQREYSWERPQLEDLWNDVTLAGKDGMTHFIGSFLYIPEEDSTATSIHRKLLIDGQQRMTTLSLLLAALLDYLDEDDSRAQFLTDLSPKSLRKSYLFNDDYRGESRYKLVLSMDDKATMQSLVDGTKLPQSPIRRLVEAKAFFTDNIRSGRVSPETLWNGLNKLVIIDTELNPNEDNAQLIFESMNSKGKPLTPIDLVRNFILLSLPAGRQKELYDQYWSHIEHLFGQDAEYEFNAFLWYWLYLKIPERNPKQDNAYHDFKYYVQNHDLDREPETILSELLAYATRYARLFLGQEPDPSLKRRFDRINSLGVRPVRPLLMCLYTLMDERKLTKDEFDSLCDTIESFLFRRMVVGKSTQGLNKMFAGMYRRLDDADNPQQCLTALLLAPENNTTGYFPDDGEFAEALTTRDIYNGLKKGKQYLLERLEDSYHPKEPINSGMYQIEHVMPQTIDDSAAWKTMLGPDWQNIHDTLCHTLGNLTLTGYNQEYSNKSFPEKQSLQPGGYKYSPLSLNRYIADCGVWNMETIRRRAEMLADRACTIWPRPTLQENIIDQYRPRPRTTSRSGSWTIETSQPELAPGGKCRELFELLQQAIREAQPNWTLGVKKNYVGYYTDSGKALHIVIKALPSSTSLGIGLNATMDDLDDPNGYAQDKRPHGFEAGCLTRVDLRSAEDIPQVMKLINQC